MYGIPDYDRASGAVRSCTAGHVSAHVFTLLPSDATTNYVDVTATVFSLECLRL
jgi:hypothetical protein